MISIGLLGLVMILVLADLVVLAFSLKIVPVHETGIYLRYGRLVGVLNPGLHVVAPLVSRVVPMDMRTQSMAVTCRNVRFVDGQRIEAVAIVDYRVTDPEKVFTTVPDARYAIADLIEKTTRSVVGRSALDDFDRRRETLNERLTSEAKKASSGLGIEAISAEIREAGTAPLPNEVPFNKRYTTPKGVEVFDTTDHEGPRKLNNPRTYGDARPFK